MDNALQYSWPGWETVGVLGKGGFGSVYEIRRQIFDNTERAALKVITIPQSEAEIKELSSEGYTHEDIATIYEGQLKRLVDEYSLMRNLSDCPNIVNCDDVRYERHTDGIGWNIYIKMELLTPLLQDLPSQPAEATVVKIATDVCKALEACQKQHLLHRDIKPQNIFISSNGTYKLGDFGIAKAAEGTMGGTKIGTYKYMAPEVYNNQPYGTAADIYSLGLVLYWLLNNRRMPFLPMPPAIPTYTEEENAKIARFSGIPIPAPIHGSPALQQIVLKACAFDPAQRYHTAAQLRADLEALVAGQPVIIADDERTVRVRQSPAATEQTVRVSPAPAPIPAPIPAPATPIPVTQAPKKKTGLIVGIVLATVTLVALLIFAVYILQQDTPDDDPSPSQEPMASTETATIKEDPIDTFKLQSVFITDSLQLEVDESGDLCDITRDLSKIAFSTSNSTVATVNNLGQVTGILPGEAVITAQYGDQIVTCPVRVSEHVTSYQEFLNAEMGETVYIESNVQAHQSWWDDNGRGSVSIYLQDQEGAYYAYEVTCSEADAARLTPGTRVRIIGEKAEWAGELEIMYGTLEFLDGPTYIAQPEDVTHLLGTDKLALQMNKKVSFKGMTVESVVFSDHAYAVDVYITMSKSGQQYEFLVEYYLTDSSTAVYQTAASLRPGDIIDITGFLYWYDGPNTHITEITKR